MIKFKVKVMLALREMTQKELAEAANLAQPAIARMESKTATPQLDTLLKILAPMGKTLAVVPLKNE